MADARIVAIGTAVPPVVLRQSDVREILLAQPGLGRVATRLVAAAVDNAAIETRYTVIGEFAGEPEPAGLAGPVEPIEPAETIQRDESAESDAARTAPLFYDRSTRRLLHPTTGERNAVYVRQSTPLALAAARRALADAPVRASDITHVITVSCTGFFAPGVDYELVTGLGLAREVRRLNIGFMGCHGAFPALRTAVEACRADPAAVVLIVCVELCTLHLRSSEDPDQIVSSAVFGDGAAAAIVAAHPHAGLRVDALHSVVAPDSAEELAWTIGDSGFELTLSSALPRLLGSEIVGALAPLHPGVALPDVEHWAIHPGGRAILDRTQQALGLSDAQLAPSRTVLRDHGNMSSPTVLFVLERILRTAREGERIVATAFGPGVTVESALLTVDGGAS
ncbi:MAG TPA: type III polyketide synthase [Gryllotalpicola sp.]